MNNFWIQPLIEFSAYTLMFMVIGLSFHSLVLLFFHKKIQQCFFDLSMAFMVSGLFNQNAFLAIYYGYYYAIFFHVIELILFSFLSLYGSENPLDNVCKIANKHWEGLLSIPFQILGAFIAANMSLYLWNLRYKNSSSNKTSLNVSVQPFLSSSTPESFCDETLKENAIEGFYLEFLGSLVRLVLKVWKVSQNRWKNEVVVVFLQIMLKIQGPYTSNYIVNPTYIVTYSVLCPSKPFHLILNVYCFAPVIGSLCANFFKIIPGPKTKRYKVGSNV